MFDSRSQQFGAQQVKVSPRIASSCNVATSVKTESTTGAEVKENELSQKTFPSHDSLAQTDRPIAITQTGKQTVFLVSCI